MKNLFAAAAFCVISTTSAFAGMTPNVAVPQTTGQSDIVNIAYSAGYEQCMARAATFTNPLYRAFEETACRAIHSVPGPSDPKLSERPK